MSSFPVPADAEAVVVAARAWLGTPYIHQASLQGVGADCLGLARGVWRAVVGPEPFLPPPYTRDWGEAGGREVLHEAASRLLIAEPLREAGPGSLLLFRMAPRAPAKHCGILAPGRSTRLLIHACEGAGVIEEAFTHAWSRRAAFAFRYPARD